MYYRCCIRRTHHLFRLKTSHFLFNHTNQTNKRPVSHRSPAAGHGVLCRSHAQTPGPTASGGPRLRCRPNTERARDGRSGARGMPGEWWWLRTREKMEGRAADMRQAKTGDEKDSKRVPVSQDMPRLEQLRSDQGEDKEEDPNISPGAKSSCIGERVFCRASCHTDSAYATKNASGRCCRSAVFQISASKVLSYLSFCLFHFYPSLVCGSPPGRYVPLG